MNLQSSLTLINTQLYTRLNYAQFRHGAQNLTFSTCVLSLHSSEVGYSHFQDIRLLHLRITRSLQKEK